MRLERREWLLLGAIAVVVIIVIGAIGFLGLPSDPGEGRYGYSVSIGTTARLDDVTLILPLPSTPDGGPLVDAIRTGQMDAPSGWNLTVVNTDEGPMLGIEVGVIPAEVHPDGHRYSTYTIGLSVPAPVAIDTRTPHPGEPLLRPRTDQRAIPCPNRARPGTIEECSRYESRVYAAYEAAATAEVDIYVVAGGMNDLAGNGRLTNRYHDRVTVHLDGPQGGWVGGEGFLSMGMGTYTRFDPLWGGSGRSEILIPAHP